MSREFPGGPLVRTQRLQFCGPGSIPGQGTKILQAAQCGQNIYICIFMSTDEQVSDIGKCLHCHAE